MTNNTASDDAAMARAPVQLAPPSPRNGNRLPVGKHPGHTGGKKGRSGRKRDAFKAALESVRDEHGLPTLEQVLGGVVHYTLRGVCEHCGKESNGTDDLEKLIPSIDAKLRATEMTLRYTLGLEKTIRLEGGLQGTQAALDLIREVIRATLPPEMADRLITDIQEALRTQLARRL